MKMISSKTAIRHVFRSMLKYSQSEKKHCFCSLIAVGGCYQLPDKRIGVELRGCPVSPVPAKGSSSFLRVSKHGGWPGDRGWRGDTHWVPAHAVLLHRWYHCHCPACSKSCPPCMPSLGAYSRAVPGPAAA